MPRRSEPHLIRARREASALFRQLAKAELVDLIGIVKPGGAFGGKLQGESEWTLQLPLIAWRTRDGPIQQTQMTARQRVRTESALQAAMKRFHDYDIVRLKAHIATIKGAREALVVRHDGAVQDRDMAALVKKLQQPVRIKDARLGILTLDRASGGFQGTVTWSGRGIRVNLSQYQRSSPDDALGFARHFFRARRRWELLIKSRILSDAHKEWNEVWRQDDPPMTQTRFHNKLRPQTIYFEPDGSFVMAFDAGVLFGGYNVIVRGHVRRGIKEVTSG